MLQNRLDLTYMTVRVPAKRNALAQTSFFFVFDDLNDLLPLENSSADFTFLEERLLPHAELVPYVG